MCPAQATNWWVKSISIDSEKSYIYSNSTVEILESNVKGVYINNGEKSKIINTDIIEGNI